MTSHFKLTFACMVLAVSALAPAQLLDITGPKVFDADGTILISGRAYWDQPSYGNRGPGHLTLIDWSEFTGVNYNYLLAVEEWFVPAFDRKMVYEGPIARIKFIGFRGTSYPTDVRIGIGFARKQGNSAQGFYEFDTHYARVNSNPNPPPVPEPATLIALSAGLVALVRKRRS